MDTEQLSISEHKLRPGYGGQNHRPNNNSGHTHNRSFFVDNSNLYYCAASLMTGEEVHKQAQVEA